MQITIEIPDRIVTQLADNPEALIRRSLELLAVEAYRKGTIGAGEVGQMLGFSSRWDTYDFLQQENAEPPYTEADLERDLNALMHKMPPIQSGKTASDLLKHVGTWQGDDLEDCLNFVRETRSEAAV